jgi:ferric-dicitrate binding protein FerR (iron transport regulator)
MTFQEFDNLMKRYLQGNCTKEEERLVEEWYSTFVKEEGDALSKPEQGAVEQKIWKNLEQAKFATRGKQRFMPDWRVISRVAAVLLIVVISVVVFYTKLFTQRDDSSFTALSNKETFENTGGTIRKITLEDGSVVSLEPGSELRYSPETFTSNREIYLMGEAFFEVVKDKEHPFLVYTTGLTTKVLGTSFRVKAYKDEKEIVVAVTTGKVSVFKQPDQKENSKETIHEVILIPNQQAVYHKKEDTVEKTLMEEPRIVLSEPSLKRRYVNTRVAEVFEALEQNYGVDIEFDKITVENCTITTTLDGEGLYNKMEIICDVIGARYTVDGTSIVVEAHGCD